MALLLTSDDVASLATNEITLEAMRRAFDAEARGLTNLPVRVDTSSPAGFLRVMPAVLDGVMGLKVMTLVRDLGTRYVVLLFDVETGGLVAMVDADEVTRARTAATTALAALHMVPSPPRDLAVIGTGFEAEGHLRFFHDLWGLAEVHVFSRSQENRERFAARLGADLDLTVVAAPSMPEALASSGTVLLATKSKQAVVDGTAFRPGTVVLSIGSTRPDLRELDAATLERADVLVVDGLDQVLHESGDIIEAAETGVLPTDRIVPLASLCAKGETVGRPSGTRDLSVFKSAGTALQDLALVEVLVERARSAGLGREIGEVPRLKAFA